jgi:transcriptional antiterminator NusG
MAKWYIIHTVSGSEKGVKKIIEDQILKNRMSDFFKEIVVPVIEVPEIKKGKKILAEKKFMPGYILIKMKMSDESWHLVRSVPKVTGFLGSKTAPQSLSENEVKRIFYQLEDASKTASLSSMFYVGDKVQVIDGPFDSFSGLIEEVNIEEQKLKVAVSIFGKATPIELGFTKVKKMT